MSQRHLYQPPIFGSTSFGAWLDSRVLWFGQVRQDLSSSFLESRRRGRSIELVERAGDSICELFRAVAVNVASFLLIISEISALTTTCMETFWKDNQLLTIFQWGFFLSLSALQVFSSQSVLQREYFIQFSGNSVCIWQECISPCSFVCGVCTCCQPILCHGSQVCDYRSRLVVLGLVLEIALSIEVYFALTQTIQQRFGVQWVCHWAKSCHYKACHLVLVANVSVNACLCSCRLLFIYAITPGPRSSFT